jgi:hypothetical protein
MLIHCEIRCPQNTTGTSSGLNGETASTAARSGGSSRGMARAPGLSLAITSAGWKEVQPRRQFHEALAEAGARNSAVAATGVKRLRVAGFASWRLRRGEGLRGQFVPQSAPAENKEGPPARTAPPLPSHVRAKSLKSSLIRRRSLRTRRGPSS